MIEADARVPASDGPSECRLPRLRCDRDVCRRDDGPRGQLSEGDRKREHVSRIVVLVSLGVIMFAGYLSLSGPNLAGWPRDLHRDFCRIQSAQQGDLTWLLRGPEAPGLGRRLSGLYYAVMALSPNPEKSR